MVVQVLGSGGEACALLPAALDAQPRDLNVIPDCEYDDRTLDKLLDGVHQTMDDHHMWLTPFNPQDTWLSVELGEEPVEVYGLVLWNYNKSPDDTYRGVKHMRAFLDGVDISPPAGVPL